MASNKQIDAVRDRGYLCHLTGLFWQNLQELLGKEKANVIYDYYMGADFPAPTAMYCDALIHCQLVNFEEVPESINHYAKAIAALNKEGFIRFPVREDFYTKLDEVYDPLFSIGMILKTFWTLRTDRSRILSGLANFTGRVDDISMGEEI